MTLGSVAEERRRLAQTLDTTSTAAYLLRTPSILAAALPRPARGSVAVELLRPELLTVHNSARATPDNFGGLWAGRGYNVLLRGGVALRFGNVAVVAAPELRRSQNLGFQTIPSDLSGQQPAAGPYVAPWFQAPYAIDLPLRFGDQSITRIAPGQSSATVTLGRVAVGFSTENQWWGPGVRNALLIGNAADGVPHAFLRTARPLRTGIGDVEARWIVGALTESLVAVTQRELGRVDSSWSQSRALSGAVVTLRLRAEPDLTLGVARLVVAPQRAAGSTLTHAADVFFKDQSLGRGDTLRTGGRLDQLASVFARWVFPGTGAELYGEFARSELPRSGRDFLLAPMHTGAYTLGAAKAFALPRARAVRATFELTNLEQNRTFTDRPPPPDYYTGRAAPAGFTQRGQVLGAPIGPGSQSQWAAVDYYAPAWQAGVFAQRVRNQNDAFYRVYLNNYCRHDATLGGGARGGLRWRGWSALAEATVSNRLNYLFQDGCANYLGVGTVDLRNLTLTLRLSPAGGRR